MAPNNRPLRIVSASAAAASLVALARPAFIAVQGLGRPAQVQGHVQHVPEQPAMAASSPVSSGAVVGTWALATCVGVVASRRPARTSRNFFGGDKAEEKKAPAKEAMESKEPKEPFDVFKPDTYGNITMEDVKKYGQAGTLSYVITELLFWAIAFPSEFAIFYQTFGRWPDLSIDADKATVFGFIFAASNIARAVLPLRFGAALAIAPWVDENIIQRFQKGDEAKAEGK